MYDVRVLEIDSFLMIDETMWSLDKKPLMKSLYA